MKKNNTIQWVLFPARGLKEFGRNLGKFQYASEFNKSSNSYYIPECCLFLYTHFSHNSYFTTAHLISGHILQQSILLLLHNYILTHKQRWKDWQQSKIWRQMSPYSRCPMSWHCTVSARHHTLLVYEGNQKHGCQSDILVSLKFWRVQVYSVSLHDTVHFQPCDLFFLRNPLLSGVVTSDSVLLQIV